VPESPENPSTSKVTSEREVGQGIGLVTPGKCQNYFQFVKTLKRTGGLGKK
jgi:hypothetical protein